jgi:hypothetical protein
VTWYFDGKPNQSVLRRFCDPAKADVYRYELGDRGLDFVPEQADTFPGHNGGQLCAGMGSQTTVTVPRQASVR